MPEATKVFPDGSINCCISSPPYWALRDYGVDGQLGLEKTFEEYIDKLCTIYDEVKRVLRDDGTCWVNLGDTYGSGTGEGGTLLGRDKRAENKRWGSKPIKGFQKSLLLIPQRFAIEMVNRGWILRNVLIWHKPNPMPSSAKDRFTVDFEYVYFFVKSKKYWFEPQYEPHKEPWRSTGRIESSGPKALEQIEKGINQGFGLSGNIPREYNPLGRNKRTVWTIPTQSFPEAHFATFPEKLVEPMIKAGCPEFVCTKCGKAREKIWDTKYEQYRKPGKWLERIEDKRGLNRVGMFSQGLCYSQHYFKGYTDCGCKDRDWRPGIVLDCFCWNLYHWQGCRKAG